MTRDDVTPAPGRREAVIIVNPAAHKPPSAKRLREADALLKHRGWSTTWLTTKAPGDAVGMAAEAARRGVPLLFVCGGDGTLNEAVNGLAGSATALAPIPGGTSNIWARETGMDKKPAEAVRLALEGDRRRVDLGRAGQRYFLLMAGYGIDAAVTRRVSLLAKKRLGATAYVIAALREWLTYRGVRATLAFDGETLERDVLMLVLGNTRVYAGLTQITNDAVADDGLLDACVYQGKGRLDVAIHTILTALRLHRRWRKVVYRRFRELRISWSQPLPLQLDGDPQPEAPTVVTVVPAALWVAVPKGFRSPIFAAPPAPAPQG